MSRSKEIEEVTRTANANNVRIYALYPEGMGSEGLTRADLTESPSQVFDHIVLDNELSAMGEVSQKTGGTLAWGSQDIVRVLPGMGDDFNSYYSLAYRATASGSDRAHRIVVKMKNPNYTVRSRGEYVEKSDTTRMKDRVVANLFGSAARGTIPLAVSLGTAEVKGNGRWTLPVVVSFPALRDHETTRPRDHPVSDNRAACPSSRRAAFRKPTATPKCRSLSSRD